MKDYFKKYFLPLSGIYLLLFLLIISCKHFFYREVQISFLSWDAEHYHFIRENGYEKLETAFFPLFPFLWRFLNLSEIEISILNGLLFTASLAFLFQMMQIQTKEYILLAAVPSFVFCFYPYTEAIFFAASTGLLYGIRKNNLLVETIFLFLLSMTRPTISVLLPAVLIVHLYQSTSLKEKIVSITAASVASIAGLLCTFSIHHYYTGSYTSFFQSQKLWGNQLSLPDFPLTSWAGGLITRLDGTALFICFIGLGFIIYEILVQRRQIKNDKLLSLLYLAGCGILILFFRKGVLFSLNRFALCTPFFIVAFREFIEHFHSPSYKKGLVIFLILSVFWLAFGSYVHIMTLLKYEALSLVLICTLFMRSINKTINLISSSIVSIGCVVLFIYLYFELLFGRWVG